MTDIAKNLRTPKLSSFGGDLSSSAFVLSISSFRIVAVWYSQSFAFNNVYFNGNGRKGKFISSVINAYNLSLIGVSLRNIFNLWRRKKVYIQLHTNQMYYLTLLHREIFFRRVDLFFDKKCSWFLNILRSNYIYIQCTYLTSSGNLLKVISAVVGNPESITCPTSLSFANNTWNPIPSSPQTIKPP